MRMGVDESGEEERASELHDLTRSRCAASRSNVRNATVLYADSAVSDWRLCNRQDPTRGV